jgi:hypothetical protein
MRQDNDQTNNGRRDESTTGQSTGHRYTVHEAALLMGLSVDAVRKRAERGTLKREKAPDGTVYILLDVDQPTTGRSTSQQSTDDQTTTGQSTLVDSLNEQVEYLRRELEIRDDELRRKDHLLATALERIPAIEPPETPEASERAGEPSDTTTEEPRSATEEAQEPSPERRSWWHRIFGG